MSDYRVADGFDVAYDDMTELEPQPASPGIQYTRRGKSANGTIYKQGAWVPLVYSAIGSIDTYQAILTDYGILNADSNEVTVYVRNDNFSYVRMNGVAIKPVPGDGVDWRMPFPRNIVIEVINLVAAS